MPEGKKRNMKEFTEINDKKNKNDEGSGKTRRTIKIVGKGKNEIKEDDEMSNTDIAIVQRMKVTGS